jgi:hypothetical protein
MIGRLAPRALEQLLFHIPPRVVFGTVAALLPLEIKFIVLEEGSGDFGIFEEGEGLQEGRGEFADVLLGDLRVRHCWEINDKPGALWRGFKRILY